MSLLALVLGWKIATALVIAIVTIILAGARSMFGEGADIETGETNARSFWSTLIIGAIFIVLLFLFACSARAAQVEVPTAPAYQPSREELLETVQHIGSLAQSLQDDLNNEKTSELQISKSLSGASDALVTATAQNKVLQTKIDTLALHAGSLEMQVAKDKAKLLRRDIIIAALALAIGVYAFLKFYLRVPFL